MPNLSINLLTLREQETYYSLPTWTSRQRTEQFTFNDDEIKVLKRYSPSSAVYFALTLVFFKAKRTLLKFNGSPTF